MSTEGPGPCCVAGLPAQSSLLTLGRRCWKLRLRLDGRVGATCRPPLYGATRQTALPAAPAGWSGTAGDEGRGLSASFIGQQSSKVPA